MSLQRRRPRKNCSALSRARETPCARHARRLNPGREDGLCGAVKPKRRGQASANELLEPKMATDEKMGASVSVHRLSFVAIDWLLFVLLLLLNHVSNRKSLNTCNNLLPLTLTQRRSNRPTRSPSEQAAPTLHLALAGSQARAVRSSGAVKPKRCGQATVTDTPWRSHNVPLGRQGRGQASDNSILFRRCWP